MVQQEQRRIYINGQLAAQDTADAILLKYQRFQLVKVAWAHLPDL